MRWVVLTAPLYDDEAADNGAAERSQRESRWERIEGLKVLQELVTPGGSVVDTWPTVVDRMALSSGCRYLRRAWPRRSSRAVILVKSGNRLLGIRGVADRPDAGRSRQRMKESFIR